MATKTYINIGSLPMYKKGDKDVLPVEFVAYVQSVRTGLSKEGKPLVFVTVAPEMDSPKTRRLELLISLGFGLSESQLAAAASAAHELYKGLVGKIVQTTKIMQNEYNKRIIAGATLTGDFAVATDPLTPA